MSWTGYGDFKPVRTAIEGLEAIGILKTQPHGSNRTTFRMTPLDPMFRNWLGEGKTDDKTLGKPMQNTGTVLPSRGSGGTASDEAYADWCAAADKIMRDFYSDPPLFSASLKGKPEADTLRRWLGGKSTSLTLHAVRLFARAERSRDIRESEVCQRFVYRRNHYLKQATECPPRSEEEAVDDIPNAISRGKLLEWFDKAAKIGGQCGLRFHNTLATEEQNALRQWIKGRQWYLTLEAIRYLNSDSESPADPCRSYFQSREKYYREAMESNTPSRADGSEQNQPSAELTPKKPGAAPVLRDDDSTRTATVSAPYPKKNCRIRAPGNGTNTISDEEALAMIQQRLRRWEEVDAAYEGRLRELLKTHGQKEMIAAVDFYLEYALQTDFPEPFLDLFEYCRRQGKWS
jgi:hypothetical protein